MPKILTANRLRDGAVVYWTGAGWSDALADGLAVAGPEAEAAQLEHGLAAERRREVVASYLLEVGPGAGGRLRPQRVREAIRALGPTVRHDLGKQADRPAIRESLDVSL